MYVVFLYALASSRGSYMPFGGDMLDGLEGQRGGAQGGLKGQGRDVGGLSGRLCGVVGFVRRGKRVNCWFWTPFFCKMSL